VTAIISGLYEVAAFFGIPPYADSPIAKTVAFLVFAGALLRIISTQHNEIVALRDPLVQFQVAPTETLQKDANFHGILHRIAVKNTSEITVTDCRLLIENWTFVTTGLSADSPMQVKDEKERQTTINRDDTKQFDLFITQLEWTTDKPQFTVIGAANLPTLPAEGGYTVIVRLTGREFSARRYKVLLLAREHSVKITRLDELTPDTQAPLMNSMSKRGW
jgi:hypothetical protein